MFKKLLKTANPKVFSLPIDDVIKWRTQTSGLFASLEWR